MVKFSFFLFFIILKFVILFDMRTLDSKFLHSFFNSINGVYTIKNGYSNDILTSINMHYDREIKLRIFFDEHCLIECLKNMHCIKYVFNQTESVCRLQLIFKRKTYNYDDDTDIAFKFKNYFKIDLLSCENGVYCMDELEKKEIGINYPLCNPFHKTGKNCEHEIAYDYSDWNQWSSCNQACGLGLRSRKRSCLRRYFDDEIKENLTLNIENNDWLCQKVILDQNLIETKQVEDCRIAICHYYTEWSEWSTCNRICNGFRNRSRTCLLDSKNLNCDQRNLLETEPCEQIDCKSSIISKIL